jgi:protein O-mannosyl-transferase
MTDTIARHDVDGRAQKLKHLLLALTLILTAIIYWPGLAGGFLFDDYSNIVLNPRIQVSEPTFENWISAADDRRASPYGRPIAMLSFAVNYYFTGLDPFWFKLTNLCLHLLNGLLLYLVLNKLLQLGRNHHPTLTKDLNTQTASLMAVLVTAAWLLAPINLTAVLYAVQRMVGIAQFFVLAGMWAYLHGRSQQLSGHRGWPWILLGLAGGVLLGLGGKEISVLLPAYALACELILLGFRNHSGKRDPALVGLFAVSVLLPAAYALFWLLPVMQESGYLQRPYTLAERLLTQLRVLVSYMHWTLIPYPTSLSFYHDDILVSKGWLSPITTLLSAGFLATALGACLACLKRAPLVSLGLLWFFTAHSLESSFIPLELVFEHRNYFASIGLLLALIYLAFKLGLATNYRLSTFLLLSVMIAWPAAVTAMRAQEWADPLRLASSEALTHPKSPRAQYELGRTLLMLSGYGLKRPLLPQATAALESAMKLPGSSILPEQALIMLAGNTGKPGNAEWWASIARKFSENPPRPEEINSLHSLLLCQIHGPCPKTRNEMMLVFVNALGHPNPDETLLANYAEFAAYILEDKVLAMAVATDAVAAAGRNKPIIQEALGPILRGDIVVPVPVAAPARSTPSRTSSQ